MGLPLYRAESAEPPNGSGAKHVPSTAEDRGYDASICEGQTDGDPADTHADTVMSPQRLYLVANLLPYREAWAPADGGRGQEQQQYAAPRWPSHIHPDSPDEPPPDTASCLYEVFLFVYARRYVPLAVPDDPSSVFYFYGRVWGPSEMEAVTASGWTRAARAYEWAAYVHERMRRREVEEAVEGPTVRRSESHDDNDDGGGGGGTRQAISTSRGGEELDAALAEALGRVASALTTYCALQRGARPPARRGGGLVLAPWLDSPVRAHLLEETARAHMREGAYAPLPSEDDQEQQHSRPRHHYHYHQRRRRSSSSSSSSSSGLEARDTWALHELAAAGRWRELAQAVLDDTAALRWSLGAGGGPASVVRPLEWYIEAAVASFFSRVYVYDARRGTGEEGEERGEVVVVASRTPGGRKIIVVGWVLSPRCRAAYKVDSSADCVPPGIDDDYYCGHEGYVVAERGV